jgi:hypothetical protein
VGAAPPRRGSIPAPRPKSVEYGYIAGEYESIGNIVRSVNSVEAKSSGLGRDRSICH